MMLKNKHQIFGLVINMICFCAFVISVHGQANPDPGSVNIIGKCTDKESVQLAILNNSNWPIGVSTYSTYRDPWKYRSLKLSSGVTVSAMPDDKEIRSLYYWVEREVASGNGKTTIEVSAFTSHGGDTSWMAPASSIIFRIPRDELMHDASLFIRINYDWELVTGESNVFNSKAVEHRAYYDGANLSRVPLPPCTKGR